MPFDQEKNDSPIHAFHCDDKESKKLTSFRARRSSAPCTAGSEFLGGIICTFDIGSTLSLLMNKKCGGHRKTPGAHSDMGIRQ